VDRLGGKKGSNGIAAVQSGLRHLPEPEGDQEHGGRSNHEEHEVSPPAGMVAAGGVAEIGCRVISQVVENRRAQFVRDFFFGDRLQMFVELVEARLEVLKFWVALESGREFGSLLLGALTVKRAVDQFHHAFVHQTVLPLGSRSSASRCRAV
jgi:hypothetical protein